MSQKRNDIRPHIWNLSDRMKYINETPMMPQFSTVLKKFTSRKHFKKITDSGNSNIRNNIIWNMNTYSNKKQKKKLAYWICKLYTAWVERCVDIWKFKNEILVFTNSFLRFGVTQIVKVCKHSPYIWKQCGKTVRSQDGEWLGTDYNLGPITIRQFISVALINSW